MGEIMHNYSKWAYQRWEMCCEERDFYGDECLELADFLNEYKEYLHKEYIKEKEAERNGNL